MYNGHGDVVQITDSAGNIVNSYEYDEWGNITSQTETIENEFKYAGQIYDSETGLYYLRARYYDPSTGRFISKDSNEGSIVNPLSLNLYTYCNNNPLYYIDPSGHYAVCDWLNNANDNYIGGPLNSINNQYIGGPLNQIASGDYTPIENAIIFLDEVGNATIVMPVGVGLKGVSAVGKGAILGKTTAVVNGKAAIKGAGKVGVPKLPSNARVLKDPKAVYSQLEKYHGINPKLASQRLHEIKKAAGRGPADNVVFDMTGNVYDPITKEWLGSLTQGGAKRIK